MKPIVLFDWGNTLMVDFPESTGKMCDWERVETVEGAMFVLESLSSHCDIYVATSAADSTEAEVKTAFERVGLDQYIQGYFCKANLGISKNCPEFYQAILEALAADPKQTVMVGDVYLKDILPAKQAGLTTVWLRPHSISESEAIEAPTHVIHSLPELLNVTF